MREVSIQPEEVYRFIVSLPKPQWNVLSKNRKNSRIHMESQALNSLSSLEQEDWRHHMS
jgi:hypothetical protein